MTQDNQKAIISGQLTLGIELGSTQIKLELLTTALQPVASGTFGWTNQYADGHWTYALEAVWSGIQTAYAEMANNVLTTYGVPLMHISTIGVSAMMHGYMVFDKDCKLLTPFRTWRDNTTDLAATSLSTLFNFHIPDRWSIAHLYQAILSHETHVARIAYMTTLAGYVHWQLTGHFVLGVGDASGMFPINDVGQFDRTMIAQFEALPEVRKARIDLEKILPKPLHAGTPAGTLTTAGALKLDPSGQLLEGSTFAPPEGDAGTGMIATNSVAINTGNISVGTSAFAMIVLSDRPKQWDSDIDIVATPTGQPVAMVHANNCSSDLNAWIGLLGDVVQLFTQSPPQNLYKTLFSQVPLADIDTGNLLAFANLSGENVTNIAAGRPLFARTPNSKFTISNFMALQLFAAFAPLQIGMSKLASIGLSSVKPLVAQGGLFKTPKIAQQVLANALDMPIQVMENGSTGGPFGMALLALFTTEKDNDLADFLADRVFNQTKSITLEPQTDGIDAYHQFITRYKHALPLAQMASQLIED